MKSAIEGLEAKKKESNYLWIRGGGLAFLKNALPFAR